MTITGHKHRWAPPIVPLSPTLRTAIFEEIARAVRIRPTALHAVLAAQGHSPNDVRNALAVLWDEGEVRLTANGFLEVPNSLGLQMTLERERLLKEHGVLAVKEATGDISADDLCRLGLVRWILGRIEDAEIGPGLDRLEAIEERKP